MQWHSIIAEENGERVSPSRLFSAIGLSIICAGYARFCAIIAPPSECKDKDFMYWCLGFALVTLVFAAVVCGNRLLMKILDSKYAATVLAPKLRKK